jgi:hypothetical protein
MEIAAESGLGMTLLGSRRNPQQLPSPKLPQSRNQQFTDKRRREWLAEAIFCERLPTKSPQF